MGRYLEGTPISLCEDGRWRLAIPDQEPRFFHSRRAASAAAVFATGNGRTAACWRPDQKALLRQLWDTMSLAEVADRVGRTSPSCRRMAATLGLTKPAQRHPSRNFAANSPGVVTACPNGTFRLDYPGHEPRHFRTDRSAYNRRLLCDSGKATSGRQEVWTEEEDTKLRELFGRIKPAEYRSVIGRGYAAAKRRAARMGLRAPSAWTFEQLERLSRHAADVQLWPKLFPDRTEKALYAMARKLNLQPTRKAEYQPWKPDEQRLLRSILTARAKLETARSPRAVNMALVRTAKHIAQQEVMFSAVRAAVPAGLPAHVREDVQQILLMQLLEKKLTIPSLGGAARLALRDVYGPRHFSLDAPLTDGSGMTWIDTVASDRAHF